MMLYPLKFIPVYKEILWGGRNIERKFKRNIPEGNIAESWEICCRKDGMSTVSNGSLKGRTLDELIQDYKESLLGKDVYCESCRSFPLLIKIIDANDKLSVQVHPGDNYEGLEDGESGKTEMWYIIDAKPGAKLVYGLKEGMTKEDLLDSIKNKNIGSILNLAPVNPGDSFYIPAGTVHAILDGILIAEIQQNSNTTYRVYDWDRVDSHGKSRDLHLNKAMDVINYNTSNSINQLHELEDYGTYSCKVLSSSKYFTVQELNIKDSYSSSTDGSKFYILMFLEGEGIISFKGGQENIKPGETVLIPAALGNYTISGNVKTLKVYI